MKAMKRVLAVALACVLLCGLLPAFASADTAESGAIVLSDAAGNPGDTVTVDLEIVSNPGVIGLRVIKPVFDETVLELKETQVIDDERWMLGEGGRIIFDTYPEAAPVGIVATYTFEILEDAEPGTTEISVELEAANLDEEMVDFTVDPSEVTVIGPAIIKSTTVMFDGKIHVRFDFLVPDTLKNLDGAYVSFEVKGAEVQRTPVTEGSAGAGGVTMFYLPVMIPEFADMITVKFHDADGRVLRIENSRGEDFTERVIYSAKTYAERMMVNGRTETERTLAKALYDYGTAAQIYFQYGEWEGLTVDSSVSDVPLADIAPYASVKSGTMPEGLTGGGMRLYFESDNTLRVTFKLDGSHPASYYTFKLDGKTVKAKSSSATECYIDVKNIPGPELSKTHAVSISDGTNTYTLTLSALSYAYIQAAKTVPELQNLGKALYLYAMATEAYFA